VAPVESTKELERVYLPEGSWFEFFTDKKHPSGEMIAECPIDRLPLYIRESSIIPMREQAGQTTNDHGDVLEIHLYHGQRSNKFLYYEDDGISYAFENGEYALRDFEYLPEQRTFIIHKKEGRYPSVFNKVKLYLHGFTAGTFRVNESVATVETCGYQFVDAISNFDPVNTMPAAPTIQALKFITFTYDDQQTIVHW